MIKNVKLLAICIALLLVCAFSLSGCNMLLSSLYPVYDSDTDTSSSSNSTSDSNDNTDSNSNSDTIVDVGGLSISSTYINDNGHLIIIYSDGTENDLGKVVGNDGNIDVNIDSTGNDASYAVALGLRSAVSVHCSFNVQNIYGGLSSVSSAGSGIIYKLDANSGDAFIVTNYHVVFDERSVDNDEGVSENITVQLYGSEYADYSINAEFVGGSNNYDIAVLRVDNCELLQSNVYREASFADSDNVYVGQSAIAIGNPDDAGISASYGIISVSSEHISLDIGGTVSLRVMRIDTPVNSGNSGGGLYNDKGELIGIVNAKSGDTSLENIGFAIPSNIVTLVADNIIDNCYETELTRVQRAMLGVNLTITDSKAYLNEDGHILLKESVSVSSVSSSGIANGILKVDDVILSVQLGDISKEIVRQHQVIDFMLNARVDDILYMTILRDVDGVKTEIDVEFEITQDCISTY